MHGAAQSGVQLFISYKAIINIYYTMLCKERKVYRRMPRIHRAMMNLIELFKSRTHETLAPSQGQPEVDCCLVLIEN